MTWIINTDWIIFRIQAVHIKTIQNCCCSYFISEGYHIHDFFLLTLWAFWDATIRAKIEMWYDCSPFLFVAIWTLVEYQDVHNSDVCLSWRFVCNWHYGRVFNDKCFMLQSSFQHHINSQTLKLMQDKHLFKNPYLPTSHLTDVNFDTLVTAMIHDVQKKGFSCQSYWKELILSFPGASGKNLYKLNFTN